MSKFEVEIVNTKAFIDNKWVKENKEKVIQMLKGFVFNSVTPGNRIRVFKKGFFGGLVGYISREEIDLRSRSFEANALEIAEELKIPKVVRNYDVI